MTFSAIFPKFSRPGKKTPQFSPFFLKIAGTLLHERIGVGVGVEGWQHYKAQKTQTYQKLLKVFLVFGSLLLQPARAT